MKVTQTSSNKHEAFTQSQLDVVLLSAPVDQHLYNFGECFVLPTRIKGYNNNCRKTRSSRERVFQQTQNMWITVVQRWQDF